MGWALGGREEKSAWSGDSQQIEAGSHRTAQFGNGALPVQFPDCYEEAVIKLVHYATLKEEELSQRVVSYFQDRFVAGEVVLGSREGGKQAPCTVVAALDPACSSHDCKPRTAVWGRCIWDPTAIGVGFVDRLPFTGSAGYAGFGEDAVGFWGSVVNSGQGRSHWG